MTVQEFPYVLSKAEGFDGGTRTSPHIPKGGRINTDGSSRPTTMTSSSIVGQCYSIRGPPSGDKGHIFLFSTIFRPVDEAL